MIQQTVKAIAVLAMTIGVTAHAAPAKKAATANKAKMAAAMPVSGNIQWTGYGVGKKHTGEVKLKSGNVQMAGKDITGGEFVFDMKTLSTADSPKLEGHLRSPDFFDVENQPEAKFVIKSAKTLAKPTADATHEINGDLTIKGKTQPMTLMAKVSDDGKGVMATGTATIPDRTAFDIKYNSAQFFDVKKLGDKMIEDKIDIKLNLQASRSPMSATGTH